MVAGALWLFGWFSAPAVSWLLLPAALFAITAAFTYTVDPDRYIDGQEPDRPGSAG